jgi:hypothetical protein
VSAKAVLTVIVVTLVGCGGAEEECGGLDLVLTCLGSDGGGDAAMAPELTIATPAHAEPSHPAAYATTAEAVRIAGTTSDADAAVFWTNSAGGEGETSPEWEFCAFSCAYDWSVTVPLAVGYNVITVVASGDGGSTAATIEITLVR